MGITYASTDDVKVLISTSTNALLHDIRAY
jgi:hypothetical protein